MGNEMERKMENDVETESIELWGSGFPKFGGV